MAEPILSWTLAVRNCPVLLERCLRSIRERTPDAEIVIVDNCSRDGTVEVAQRYADVVEVYKGPDGTWTPDDPWTYNMAASRQRAFELAHGRWRGWIDADDRLPGPEEAERLLRLNDRWQPAAGPSGNVVPAAAEPVSLTDLLLRVEEQHPSADVIWAPYLYAKDQHGAALIWQERERFVRWTDPPRWHWSEAAHEILVPVNGYKPKVKIDFAHLLFVHEREFTQEANDFAVSRHFDVLHRQYAAGDRTTRRSLYLAAYAQQLCPEREPEFVADAHTQANTALDRYRALVARGQILVRQGLFRDALEAFGGAVAIRPDLPDALLYGAEAWAQAEDWLRSADWYRKGLSCVSGSVDSYINPRFQAIRYPVMLAEVLLKIAEVYRRSARHDLAESILTEAVQVLQAVHDHPSIGGDRIEAYVRYVRARNELLAQHHAQALWRLSEYLLANDEPLKTLDLLRAVPWNLRDHPLIVGIERRVARVDRHVNDRVAYREFYEDEPQAGFIPSPDHWLDETPVPRAIWAAEWLRQNLPAAFVIDVGAFDGISAIPILHRCPKLRYVGADILAEPLDRLRERLIARGMANRATTIHLGGPLNSMQLYEPLRPYQGADVVIWFEVIEHVPEPAYELTNLAGLLHPGGYLLVSTPWGSHDCGAPPEKTEHGTPRSILGHVRAMTPRDVVQAFEWAGLAVEQLQKYPVPAHLVGDEMHIRGRVRPAEGWPPSRRGVVFAVPSALWDWNATTVQTQGMGASEKSIVQTARHLARNNARRVEVYGPVPEAEVQDYVRYWPREQLRHVQFGKLVVSRSPGYAGVLDREGIATKLKKILWLQDAYYPDLNPETAGHYEQIVVVSEWHKRAMHERHGVPLEKMTTITNPIEASLYQGDPVERKRDHFIYASSPDRGIVKLLELWPRIRERLPTATLDIFYGWRGAQLLGSSGDAAWASLYEGARRRFEELRYQPGIRVFGMTSPAALAFTFRTAGVWAYPTSFEETCCTLGFESRAAGCVPVCPPLAGLAESAKGFGTIYTPFRDDPTFDDSFLDAVVAACETSDADRARMAEQACTENDVAVAAAKWERLLDA